MRKLRGGADQVSHFYGARTGLSRATLIAFEITGRHVATAGYAVV